MQALGPSRQKDFRDDLVVPASPSFISSDSDILPVAPIGIGILRPNARQSVKSYLVAKAAIATTQTQVALPSANTRIFFLGAQVIDESNENIVYIEDASSGALTPSDNSTIPLYYFSGSYTHTQDISIVPPRECKQGIRVHIAATAASKTWVVVWYMVERTDGQVQDI